MWINPEVSQEAINHEIHIFFQVNTSTGKWFLSLKLVIIIISRNKTQYIILTIQNNYKEIILKWILREKGFSDNNYSLISKKKLHFL